MLCAEQAEDGNTENIHTADVSSNVDCCACGTAKYQLTFHSLWSQSIHPHDFPDINMSLLYWSPVVGSSHSKHYTMWRFNTVASQGIRDICQFGDTRALEDEIRHQVSGNFAFVIICSLRSLMRVLEIVIYMALSSVEFPVYYHFNYGCRLIAVNAAINMQYINHD